MGIFAIRQQLIGIVKVRKTGSNNGIKFTYYEQISGAELDKMAEEIGDIRQVETWQKLYGEYSTFD